MRSDDFIRLAMEEAEVAVREGNAPFGVLVTNIKGKVIWKDHDRVNECCDPTAHGEVSAIRGLC